MRLARHILASSVLLLAAGSALGQAQGQAQGQANAGEWASYRDVYRTMVVFEKYGGPKHLLQNQLQVLVKDHAAFGEGLQLTLAGKTTQLHLPLDPLGRTALPLQKAAYDENAALLLSRKGIAFTLRPQVALAARADGVYDSADLRSACAQALGYARHLDASQRSRQCAGVRFVFQKKGEGGVRLRHEGGAEETLPVQPGAAEEGLPTVSYRFGAERAQVLTSSVPLAILPVFE
jgi:hypothetical protein